MLTSFWDLAGISGGILSILAGVDFVLFLGGLCSVDWILGVNLAAIFLLQSLGPPLQRILLKPQEVFSRELFPTY